MRPIWTMLTRMLPSLLILVGVALVYFPTLNFTFVGLDDQVYVYRNPRVLTGWTWDNVGWAWTHFHGANYIPLVWLSYMLDRELYDDWAGGFHLTNVVLHAVTSWLVYVWLWRMTGQAGPSWLVAMLFAVHPLHVESVAWVTERKDVLSGFFGLLALVAYTEYARRGSVLCYLAAIVAFAASLLSKQMLVTLPFVLLLLDYWPLRRLNRPRLVILEKLPFLALTFVACWVAWLAQNDAKAVETLAKLPLTSRFANVNVAYVAYLRSFFWPAWLHCYYMPPRGGWSGKLAGASFLLLIGSSLIALRLGRRSPAILVGWLLFLGTLVPVIGIVQIGEQAWADRYMYFPILGLSILVVFGLNDLFPRILRSRGAWVLIACWLVALTAVAHRQVWFWKDSHALYLRGVTVNPLNGFCLTSLALVELNRGNWDTALELTEQAIAADPSYRIAQEQLTRLRTYRYLEERGRAELHFPDEPQLESLKESRAKYAEKLRQSEADSK